MIDSELQSKKARVETTTLSSTKHHVDLRSDTVTKPTTLMRQAMSEAEVGDDVFGDDPTVIKLEKEVASLFGKEASLFFPSGTMCNLVSVMTHCTKRGSEVILGSKCHIHIYEQAGIAQIAGVGSCVLPNLDDGTIDVKAIEEAIRTPNIHFPVTELIALENTHNYCGGKVLSKDYLKSVHVLSQRKNIPIHLDGARIWNAADASGLSLEEMASYVDTLSVCLSKGLGAPSGSLLVGTKSFIERARRTRKAVGGGMRQVGILAAAGLQAISDYQLLGIIKEDHRRAQILAHGLSKIDGLLLDPQSVQTNIIFVSMDMTKFTTTTTATATDTRTGAGVTTSSEGESTDYASELMSAVSEYGVKVLPKSQSTLRLVVHRDLCDEDMTYTVAVFEQVMRQLLLAAHC